ncbi:hypothetical protein [Streptomyces sp. A0592]|uniref:hypothetical protein n=1 Tax=Streptomyces sp. A0592 TaxID=2563099 RepID=UPI00109E52E8|nr:hypothetical protein [Streptomyces sp. A0592]THA80088.1 hypothetical protein E6U81_30265 [Streptomyces sp. A0592]
MTSESVTQAVEPAEPTLSKAVDDRLIDELVSRAHAHGLQLTGEGGLQQLGPSVTPTTLFIPFD